MRFETQRLLGVAGFAQSSSVWQAAQMLPLVLRTQVLLVVSQVEPRPHSRCTAAASLESQKPAHVPLSGTHCFGPVP